jgi:hypothetical protein
MVAWESPPSAVAIIGSVASKSRTRKLARSCVPRITCVLSGKSPWSGVERTAAVIGWEDVLPGWHGLSQTSRASDTGREARSLATGFRNHTNWEALLGLPVPRSTTVLSRRLTSATALKGRTRRLIATRRRLRTTISSGWSACRS